MSIRVGCAIAIAQHASAQEMSVEVMRATLARNCVECYGADKAAYLKAARSSSKPDDADLLHECAATLEDPKEELAVLERASTLAPDNGQILMTIATIHMNLNDRARSLQYMERAFEGSEALTQPRGLLVQKTSR